MQHQPNKNNTFKVSMDYNQDMSCIKLTWSDPTQNNQESPSILRIQYWVQENSPTNHPSSTNQITIPQEIDKLANFKHCNTFEQNLTEQTDKKDHFSKDLSFFSSSKYTNYYQN